MAHFGYVVAMWGTWTVMAAERVPTQAEPRPWVFWVAGAALAAVLLAIYLRLRR